MIEKSKINYKEHWNKVYSKNEVTNLGWYETKPESSLRLIAECKLNKDSVILDIGAGASTLIDSLVEAGYENIIAADISDAALDKLKLRIGNQSSTEINYVVEDISKASDKFTSTEVDLWHDRTLLHFLLTEEQRKGYLENLRNSVKLNGYVIIAVFSLEGAKKCSGLDVKNYDHKMITEFLGEEFELLNHFNYTYVQPSGNERPFVYTLFKRIKK